MDPERWPDRIREIVDEVRCPACDAPRSRVMMTVRYHPPIWHLVCNCTSCRQMHDLQLTNIGQLNPKPEVKPEPAETPLPAWVKQLR